MGREVAVSYKVYFQNGELKEYGSLNKALRARHEHIRNNQDYIPAIYAVLESGLLVLLR